MLLAYNTSKTHLAESFSSHALPKVTHSSGVLRYLHWLPVKQRIKFKLAALTLQYSLLHSACLFQFLLNYHTPTRSLRSTNTNLLSVPHVHTTFASPGFGIAAPAVWNSLPSDVHHSSSTHTFRCILETHCFQQTFGSP